MKLIEPPKSLSQVGLFCKLLEFPRPSIAIDFRFDVAETEPLFVRALSSSERRSCAGPGWQCRTIGLALCDESGAPVFSDPKDAGRAFLSEQEAHDLHDVVADALAIISPHYGAIDAQAWADALEQGASLSGHQAYALGSCIDMAGTMSTLHRMPRPDRYFGCAMRDLLDGHWLCWFAARRVIEKLSK